jgi:hypothetical protein
MQASAPDVGGNSPEASTTCLVMADHKRYSVDARAAGRMVLVRSHAERVIVLMGENVVCRRPFGPIVGKSVALRSHRDR